MTEPLILHGDARAEAITILRAGLTGRPEEYLAGIAIAGDFTGTLPALTVLSDGVVDDSGYPVAEVESVRVICRTAKADDAHDLARLARAVLLLGYSGQLKACHPGTGPFDTVDDRTDQPMSWFTVRAHMQGRISA